MAGVNRNREICPGCGASFLKGRLKGGLCDGCKSRTQICVSCGRRFGPGELSPDGLCLGCSARSICTRCGRAFHARDVRDGVCVECRSLLSEPDPDYCRRIGFAPEAEKRRCDRCGTVNSCMLLEGESRHGIRICFGCYCRFRKDYGPDAPIVNVCGLCGARAICDPSEDSSLLLCSQCRSKTVKCILCGETFPAHATRDGLCSGCAENSVRCPACGRLRLAKNLSGAGCDLCTRACRNCGALFSSANRNRPFCDACVPFMVPCVRCGKTFDMRSSEDGNCPDCAKDFAMCQTCGLNRPRTLINNLGCDLCTMSCMGGCGAIVVKKELDGFCEGCLPRTAVCTACGARNLIADCHDGYCLRCMPVCVNLRCGKRFPPEERSLGFCPRCRPDAVKCSSCGRYAMREDASDGRCPWCRDRRREVNDFIHEDEQIKMRECARF